MPSWDDSLEFLRPSAHPLSRVRKHVPWYHCVPDWLYYLVAVLITLPTIPVYLYFFNTHFSRSDSELVSSVPSPSMVHAVVSPIPFYAWNQPLPRGYKCAGADGLVYRTRMGAGAAVIEPLYQNGQLVRCGGDVSSSHRY